MEENQQEWDDFDGFWVGEPSAEYTNQSRNQFLDDIEQRLKLFMVRCLKACRVLPKEYDAQHFRQQLVRSSSSSAANFRAARRGRSTKEYYAKLSITIEELDESIFWLESLVLTEMIPENRLKDLIDEGYQLLKFLAKSRKTVKERMARGEL